MNAPSWAGIGLHPSPARQHSMETRFLVVCVCVCVEGGVQHGGPAPAFHPSNPTKEDPDLELMS